MTEDVKKHHIRHELCTTRPPYRQGRQLKAVKVYTVAQESRYLLVQGLPSVGAHKDLVKLFALYGEVEEYRLLDEYPAEEFTDVLLIKYKLIAPARVAKRKMDDFSFYGGTLHVCYAPEYETVEDTRNKLQDRRKAIAARLRKLEIERVSTESLKQVQTEDIYDTENDEGTSSETVSEAQENPGVGTSSVTPSHPHEFPSPDPGFPQTALNEPEKHYHFHYHYHYPHPNSTHNVPPLPPHFDMSVPPPTYFPKPPSVESSFYPSQSPDDHLGGSTMDTEKNTVRNTNKEQSSKMVEAKVNKSKPSARVQPLGHFKITKALKVSDKKPEANQVIVNPTARLDPSKVEIREYKNKAVPKFVPRQLAKKTPLVIKKKVDPVTEELKRAATVLGDTAGPKLPAEVEERRITYKLSETGDKSLDQTVASIRDKVTQFSEPSLEPVAKKKKT